MLPKSGTRQFPRIPVKRRALLHLPLWSSPGSTPRVELRGELRNVSRNGVAITAHVPPEDGGLLGGLAGLRPGLPLEIRFRAGKQLISVPGEVVWTRPEGDAAGDSTLGVKLNLGEADEPTRRVFEAWATSKEQQFGVKHPAKEGRTLGPMSARERLECRLALLIDVLGELVERLESGELEDVDVERVDALAELLQGACTALELNSYKGKKVK